VSAVGERYAAALSALRSVWETDRFIVIGATAIDLHIGLRWRQTFDLDLSVAAGLDTYGEDLERPWERDSDLADLSHILSGFLGPDAAERWSEEIVGLGLDFEDVGPFLIGRQLGDLVDKRERSLVQSFLDRVEDPADRLSTLHRMVRRAPAGWKEADQMGARLLAFRHGFASPS
jgi:hypothetical protein